MAQLENDEDAREQIANANSDMLMLDEMSHRTIDYESSHPDEEYIMWMQLECHTAYRAIFTWSVAV